MEQVGIEFSVITDKATASSNALKSSVLGLDSIINIAKDSAQNLYNKIADTTPVKSLSENIDEAKESVDELNISVMDLVKAQLIADMIKGVFNNIVNGAKASIPEIGQSFSRMNSIINTNFYAPLKTAVIPVLQELEKFIIENQEVFKIFGSVVANVFNMIVGVVKFSIDIISNIYQNTFGKLFGGIKQIAGTVSEYLNFTLLKIAFLFTAIQVILEPILEEIGNKIFYVFNEYGIPAVNKFIEVISFLGDAFNDPKKALDEYNESTITLASGGLALLTIGILALGKSLLATMIPAIIKATVSTYAFTTALLTNPIVLITVGVMALVGSLVLLYKNWDTIKEFVPGVIDSISESINEFYNGFIDIMNGVYESVSNTFNSVYDSIIQVIDEVSQSVYDTFNSVYDSIIQVIDEVSQSVYDTFNSVYDSIIQVIDEVSQSVYDTFNAIKINIIESINSVYESIKNTFNGIKNTIIESISSAIDFVMSYINPFIEKISNLSGKISSIKNMFSGPESETQGNPNTTTPKNNPSDISKNSNIRNETNIENKNTYNIQSTEPEAVAREIEKLENKKQKMTAKQEYNKFAPALGYY